MIEKIYFAQGLTDPTYLTYCTALRDAMADDADISEWFDISDVRDKEEGRTGLSAFTVTLKSTSASFDIQCSSSWFLAKNFKDFAGASISMAGGNFTHNLSADIPLYKIITEKSAAFQFDAADANFLTGFSKINNIDNNTENTLCFNKNGDTIHYFSENISHISMNASVDKRGNYDNFICIPWFPQNAGYMGKDLFRYDGGHALLTKGFYDIDGNRFLALSKTCNILLKCD